MEGPQDDFDYILVEAMELWRNSAKWRYLYARPEKYLASHSSQIGGNDDLHDFWCCISYLLLKVIFCKKKIEIYLSNLTSSKLMKGNPWPSIGKG